MKQAWTDYAPEIKPISRPVTPSAVIGAVENSLHRRKNIQVHYPFLLVLPIHLNLWYCHRSNHYHKGAPNMTNAKNL
jgi:hypothetical protein